jgi:hypothetical protein
MNSPVDPLFSAVSDDSSWRRERVAGIAAIAIASTVAASLWFGIRYWAPAIAGMDDIGARMVFALKCSCLAALFCLVTGVEAVAHERLQSPAFDPLADYASRRFAVNQRYLQNTLEQYAVFVTALFGLAAYCPDGDAMRAVLATTVTWILARFAFWIGYHRSAAMRGLGAPGMMVTMLALLYVGARIGHDVAGVAGAATMIAAFLLIEAILFWTTRSRSTHTAE